MVMMWNFCACPDFLKWNVRRETVRNVKDDEFKFFFEFLEFLGEIGSDFNIRVQ